MTYRGDAGDFGTRGLGEDAISTTAQGRDKSPG